MIKKYWPEYLQGYDKFCEIDRIESDEILELWNQIRQLEDNQFIVLSDEKSLSRYEKIAKIRAKPSDSIQTRRSRLLNKLSNYIPYNRNWLHCKLDSVLGENMHEHVIDDDVLRIKTNTDEIDSIKSLRKELRKDIPCTMDMNIGLVRTSHQPMYMGSIARVGKITTITPSNQVTINVQNNNEIYVGTYVRTVKKVTIGGN